MNFRTILFNFFLFFNLLLNAQPYFQQEVNYTIDVTLNDHKHELYAFEAIEYVNHSPDTLNYLWFHIWPNAYKNHQTALSKQLLENDDTFFYYANDKYKGYIDSLDFKVNNKDVLWEYHSEHIDICKIFLNNPLLPGEKITITTPFKVKIPLGLFSRLGHIGQSYQITQWYPKPAVYDKDGWHPMPYLDQGEFYSEFGSYSVNITLPENYVVGATGNLLTPNEENWLDSIAEACKAIDFNIPGIKLLSSEASHKKLKTLKYYQENVHDFAWFADKRFFYLKGEVELPYSKRKVKTQVMFTPNECELWQHSIEYLNDAVYYYSLWNGDYPYDVVTAVDGTISSGSGMEYPTITIIGTSNNAFTLEETIMHEVGHNWFYGILGSNERDHPWMDEGLNTLNESRYIATKYPEKLFLSTQNSLINKLLNLKDFKYNTKYELYYLLSATKNMDQPIEEKSQNFSDENYGNIVYDKTGVVFHYLKAYLGDSLFDTCMHRYYDKWKFKHPQPSDLKEIFEKTTNKNLDWFFNDLLNTTKKIDYKIQHIKKKEGNYIVTLKNKGKVSGPLFLQTISSDSIISSFTIEPFQKSKEIKIKAENIDKIKIDSYKTIPEINRQNNTIKTKGLFKKCDPVLFQFFSTLNHPDYTEINFFPIMGWNNYDKNMIGMAFHNINFPYKKNEIAVLPMYAVGSNTLTGMLEYNHYFHPQKTFQYFKLSLVAKRFSQYNYASIQPFAKTLAYNKIAPVFEYYKKFSPRKKNTLKITFKLNTLLKDTLSFINDINGFRYTGINQALSYIPDLSVKYANKRIINPYQLTFNTQFYQNNSQQSAQISLTAAYTFSYKKEKTGFNIRFFAGKYFPISNHTYTPLSLSMHRNPETDYTYDHYFLERNATSGWMNQQFFVNDGGFKIPTTVNSSNNLLLAVNLKTNLPLRFLGLFADFGVAQLNTSKFLFPSFIEKTQTAYDLGGYVSILPDILEVYFPFSLSSDLNQLKYYEKIRFTINLSEIKPLEILRTFEL